MRIAKLAIPFILFLFVVIDSCVAQEKKVITEAKNRCVEVTAYETLSNALVGMGTGVVVETNVVVTNYHVVPPNTLVLVDGVPARITKVSREDDLVSLLVELPQGIRRIEFDEDTYETEDVFYVGNPARFRKLVSTGKVLTIQDGLIFTDTVAIPGFSGSGLYGKNGKLKGIQKVYSTVSGTSIAGAIPASKVRKFLGWKP